MNYNQIYEIPSHRPGAGPLPVKRGVDPRASHGAQEAHSQIIKDAAGIHDQRPHDDPSQQIAHQDLPLRADPQHLRLSRGQDLELS